MLGQHILSIGNLKFMERQNISDLAKIKNLSVEKTGVYAAQDQKLIAHFSLTDTLKPRAKEAIEYLKSQNITPILLSGDLRGAVKAVANPLRIDQFFSQMTPQQKVEKITELKAGGEKVAMVGDGINDGPALLASDLGIAIGTGTDLAIESAKIILLH